MMQRFLLCCAPALGITTLCCLWIVGPLAFPDHDVIYHWSGPASTLFLPALLDFGCVWLLFTLVLLAVRAQGTGRKTSAIWTGIIVLLPWATLKSWASLNGWILPHWVSPGLFAFSLAVLMVSLLRWGDAQEAILGHLQKFFTTVLCFVGVWGLLIVAQLSWFGWKARLINTDLSVHATHRQIPSQAKNHPRIIWIVFDELSYQQVYERRFRGLQLPAFDQLHTEATIFTHIVPAGTRTNVVLPSLMTGIAIDRINPSADGKLLDVHNSKTRAWQTYDQHATVFQDALDAGYQTAVAGWYIPYCRIFPEVLDRCFWTYDEASLNKMLPRASLMKNALNTFLLSFTFNNHLLPRSISVENAYDVDARLHISDYRTLFGEADQLLDNPSLDFILLHMPIPHPAGIYDRKSHTFVTRNSTYLDNLALSDSFLAHVRSVLEAKGQWDSSAVVIMGDHSWRTTLLWASTPYWTKEEQQASNGGGFDDRPGYIIKLPNQKVGSVIDHTFAAVETRSLLDAMMNGKIESSQTLSLWVESHH